MKNRYDWRNSFHWDTKITNKYKNLDIDAMVNRALNSLIGDGPSYDEMKDTLSAPNQVQSVYSSGNTTPEGYGDFLAFDQVDSSASKKGSGGMDWLSSLIGGAIGFGRDLLGYAHADKAAEVAYDRQNDFYNNHISMSAKVQEYQEAGLNPMALGSSGVGATSAPSVGQGDTPAGGGMTEILSTLLNYKLKTRELDQQAELLPARMEQYYANADYRRELTDWVAPLAETTIGQMTANTGLLLQRTETEEAQKRLNEAGISVATAQSALLVQEALYKVVQNQFAVEWQRTELALKRSYQALNASQSSLNYSHIQVNDENIKKIMDERTLICAKALESGAMKSVLEQHKQNLGITEEMLRFDADHQKARYTLEMIGGYTGATADALEAGADVYSTIATGGLSKGPKRPMKFEPGGPKPIKGGKGTANVNFDINPYAIK